MDPSKVDMYLMVNARFFQPAQLPFIRERLISLDDSRWQYLQSVELKDPTVGLVLSLFAGSWGVDRFYLNDTGLGVLKLLTCGGFFVWTVIDWFLVMDLTRQKNIEMLLVQLEQFKY